MPGVREIEFNLDGLEDISEYEEYNKFVDTIVKANGEIFMFCRINLCAVMMS